MADNKTRAHDLALAWWASDAGHKARKGGKASCDGCLKPIGPEESYLASPVYRGTDGPPDSEFPHPELTCGSCFDRRRKAWNPDGSGVLGRPLTPPEKLFPPSVPSMRTGGRKPFWRFW